MRDRINAPIAIAPPSRARPRARALATPSIRRKLFPSTVSRRRSSHRAFARVVTPPERPRRDPASRARVVESSHLDRRRRGLGLGFALGAHDHGRALRAALRRARGGAREGDGVQGSREHRGACGNEAARRAPARDRSTASFARETRVEVHRARAKLGARFDRARCASIDRSRARAPRRRHGAFARALRAMVGNDAGLKSSSYGCVITRHQIIYTPR